MFAVCIFTGSPTWHKHELTFIRKWSFWDSVPHQQLAYCSGPAAMAGGTAESMQFNCWALRWQNCLQIPRVSCQPQENTQCDTAAQAQAQGPSEHLGCLASDCTLGCLLPVLSPLRKEKPTRISQDCLHMLVFAITSSELTLCKRVKYCPP